MILTENKCKVCGEPIDIRTAVSGVVDCRHCGASYSVGNNVEGEIKIKLVQADSYLQMCKFDEAKETFLQAAKLQTDEATAYFGAALAEFGVQYLPTEDIIDGELKRKLIPISHRYTLDKSFLENKYYLKALECASSEQKKQFEQEAAAIEHIRKQFLMHKKSGLYFDAFICVKVSDPGNKNKKTQDSIFAYKIYDTLKDKGYSPFYSEKSIGGECVGTDYEAMILYALHCSRCMIIVCFDKEYLDSPWVKNEYRRYVSLLQDGRKPEQSLVFIYDNEIIDRLPGISGAIQSLNKNDGMSFNPGLMHFVEKNCRTLDKKAVAEIEFKKVQSGEVAAKAKRVEGAAINYAQLGSIEVSQLTPDEENKLNIANRYLGKGMFDDALLLFSSIIKNNPRNQQAYWGRILCSVEATNEKALAARIDKFDNWEDFKLLISLADKKSANDYVERLMNAAINYTVRNDAKEQKAIFIIKNLILYKTDGWDKFFAEMKRIAVEKLYADLLTLLLEYIDRSDVDEYIRIYNELGSRYMDSGKLEAAKEYFDKALALDEGSGTALLCNFRITNKCGDSKRYIFSKNSALTDFSNFDKLLKFSDSAQAKKIISDFIQALLSAVDSGNVPISGYFKEAFDRIIAINITDKASGKAVVDEEFLASSFLAISEMCLKFEEFALAENYFALSLKYGKNNPRAYWGMLKAKLRAKDDDDLVNSNIDLSKLPEYESVLVCADDQFCDVVVDVRKKQKEQLPRTLTSKQTLLDKFARVGFSEEELNLLNGPYNMRELDTLFETKQKALDLMIQKEDDERKRIKRIEAAERERLARESDAERERIKRMEADERKRIENEAAAKRAREFNRKRRLKFILFFIMNLCIGLVFSGIFLLVINFAPLMGRNLGVSVSISIISAIIILIIYFKILSKNKGRLPAFLIIFTAVIGIFVIKFIAAPGYAYYFDFNGNVTLGKYYGNETEIVVPENVLWANVKIGDAAFNNYISLTAITIPDNVTSIGNSAFEGTAWYDNQPDGLIYAGKVAYKYKGTMPVGTSIVLEEGTKVIADQAFRDYGGLATITIPDSVTSIGYLAFSGCSGLTSITIPDSVTSIGYLAFHGCSNSVSTMVPEDLTVTSDMFKTRTKNNEVIIAGLKNDYNLTPLIIPSKIDDKPVVEIKAASFKKNNELSLVVIPDSVKKIGKNAFRKCTDLETVFIGNGTETIDNYAFYGCTNLKKVVIGSGIKYIGNDAFIGNGGQNRVYLILAETPPKYKVVFFGSAFPFDNSAGGYFYENIYVLKEYIADYRDQWSDSIKIIDESTELYYEP